MGQDVELSSGLVGGVADTVVQLLGLTVSKDQPNAEMSQSWTPTDKQGPVPLTTQEVTSLLLEIIWNIFSFVFCSPSSNSTATSSPSSLVDLNSAMQAFGKILAVWLPQLPLPFSIDYKPLLNDLLIVSR